MTSGPADLGVRGGVGGWPPPEGELEFPSRAEDRKPGGKGPRGPKLDPELGESVRDDEVGGDESFSEKRKVWHIFIWPKFSWSNDILSSWQEELTYNSVNIGS